MKIAWARLHCQRLASGRLSGPVHVVEWLGAVQAQEYRFAKWGLALRMRRAGAAAVERALAAGSILRTHVLRATWHFVSRADIRWLLALTAPRVRAAVAYYDRQLGITPALVACANRAIASALAGGAELTRAELKAVLAGVGVATDGTQRLSHVIMHAELDGVICSGPRRANQLTYALLDARAPVLPMPSRDEALGETITLDLPRRVSASETGPPEGAVRRYGDFLGLDLVIAHGGDCDHGNIAPSGPSYRSESSLCRTAGDRGVAGNQEERSNHGFAFQADQESR